MVQEHSFPFIFNMRIYDKENITTLPWDQVEEGIRFRTYLEPIVINGIDHYFDNVNTQIKVLHIDHLVLPFTINTNEYCHSYVCSPYDHYITYALQEIPKMGLKAFQGCLQSSLNAFGKVLKWSEINKVITMNNWLFSTNLYPRLTVDQILRIKTYFLDCNPDHALVFRTLNEQSEAETQYHLLQCGYRLILNRPVYLIDTNEQKPFTARMFKSDLKVLNRTDYEILDKSSISHNQASRLADLYHDLNIRKYSSLNPQMNANFFRHALSSDLFDFKAWQKNGRIDAILGFYKIGGVMTAPIFGYDTSLPQKYGLYRRLSAALTLEAKKMQVYLHASSGGGSFKKLRRAKREMEYIAVYFDHLEKKRRIVWRLLKYLLNGPGYQYLKYFDP